MDRLLGDCLSEMLSIAWSRVSVNDYLGPENRYLLEKLSLKPLKCAATCRTLEYIQLGKPYGDTIMAAKDKKDERLEARCPSEVKQRIEHAAELQGRSMTDFLVSAAD